uniref:AlNc14C1G108 protein n=1 Tax=Albugo laibachii Nc14 TaxID=890382 RepID=F0VYV7_9STRA|nr:AlNc14C1G108 [Albugo laibachii Nc14]|eukprot:CCA13972.1 AlNc14C1G108 [Albugo laibachii Nc14]
MPSCISYESNIPEFIQDEYQQTMSSYECCPTSPLFKYEPRNQIESNNILSSRLQDGGSNLSLLSLPEPNQSSSSSPSSSTDSKRPESGTKRKRVVLSIFEKHQVLQRLDLGEQPILIARDFGISRQQVSDIKKNKERILSFCIDAKHLSSLRKKTLRAAQNDYHPGVEQGLYRWIIRQRFLGRNITSDMLISKVSDLFTQYMFNGVIGTLNRFRCSRDGLNKTLSAEDQSTLNFMARFPASSSDKSIFSWLRNFKRAHRIRSLSADELAKLPKTFTPAMDTFVIHESSDQENSCTIAISENCNENEFLTSNSAFLAPHAWSTQPNVPNVTETLESLRQKHYISSPSQGENMIRTGTHSGDHIHACMLPEEEGVVLPNEEDHIFEAVSSKLICASSSAKGWEDVNKVRLTLDFCENSFLSSGVLSSLATATAPSFMTLFQAISKQMDQLERTVNIKLHSLNSRLAALRGSTIKTQETCHC